MNDKIKGWYKRHINLIIKEGWSKEEYDYILDSIINEKVKTINEIIPHLNNKSIDELVNLLQNELKIGNKAENIILNCAYCGNEIIRNMNEIHKDRVYCDMNCRNKYKKEYGIHRGKNNSRYNSSEVHCTNCDKIFLVPQYEINRKNSFGENHHFCCKECYWEYRKKYYVGEKSSMYNYKFSQKQINRMRENTVKMFTNGKFPTKLTKPHLKINKLLDEMNIKYINEKAYKYYSVDIYLPDNNLIIEIMGDYFHGNPLKYKEEDLNKMQLKNIRKDKSKHTYLKRYYDIEILYLWEEDINNNIKLCKKMIYEYIKNNGILKEYNSYKYN